MTDMTFAALGLSQPLLRALGDENYAAPTPIQAKAIPALLEGRDLLGIAQTGTGKTAAFALPMLQKLTEVRTPPAAKGARALILAPTRELAIQIEQAVEAYGRYLGLRMAVILGGVNQNGQVRAMARGVDILVATPGRLLDLVGQKHVRLDGVSILVVDEADRMLDMGFIRDVRKLVATMPRKRQSMLFSATMPGDIARLAAEMMQNPVKVEVAPQGRPADRITQTLYHVPMAQKRLLLTQLLDDVAMNRVIVFTRTKHGANRVAQHLEKQGIGAQAIHGNKSQNARQRALELFRNGKARVLVATDIAARGIDIDDISHVVNFELPNDPESYVHRIGRTARAGGEGAAISFCDATERGYLRDIERLIGSKIQVEAHTLPELTPEQIQQNAAQTSRQNRPQNHGHGQPRGGKGGIPDGVKKRGGARPHWQKARGAARKAGGSAKSHGANGHGGPRH